MIRLRRSATFALALILSAFGVVPHQHDGLVERISPSEMAQVGHCETQEPSHFHAARPEIPRPCVACVRQHSAGALLALSDAVERPIALGTPAVRSARPRATSILFTPLRAPPA